ncbi:MAG: DUF4870 domain-containing protein [Candidatus Acidiferrales bacterium]
MPHCPRCGTVVAENAGFCPNCGAAQPSTTSAPAVPPATPSVTPSGTSGMSENVAALLSYVLGWVTGLIFFLIDKRPFVRFHAAQSIVVFGGLTIIRIAVGMLLMGSGMGFGLLVLISLLGVVLWILLMVKAYQGERYRVPIAADLAEQMFGKS